MKTSRKVNDTFDIALGIVLFKHRTEKKMAQQEVANKVGCTRQMISYYEKGISAITVTQLKKIGDVYGCTYYDLIQEAVQIMAKEDEK